MNINQYTKIPVFEKSQNLSKAVRLIDRHGPAVMMKNNEPQDVIYKLNRVNRLQVAADDDVLAASELFQQRNQHVYEELAK